MVKKYKLEFQKFLLSLLVFLPILTEALNLGGMVTNSLQGEPLNADIELIDISKNFDPRTIKVKLANSQQLLELGLSAEPYHNDLNFNIYKAKDSRWYIRVKSSQLISSQFVNFLLNIEYPQGKIVREYMAILKKPIYSFDESDSGESQEQFNNFQLATAENDKQVVRFMGDFNGLGVEQPVLDVQKNQIKNTKKVDADLAKNNNVNVLNNSKINVSFSQAKNSQTSVVAKLNSSTLSKSKSKVKEINTGNIDNKLKSSKSVATVKNKLKNASNLSAELQDTKEDIKLHKITITNKPLVEFKSENYKVLKPKSGQTLWEIAKDNITAGKNIQKMVMAIYQINQASFINNNVNLLRQDIKLKIPQEQDITKISYSEALMFIASHNNKYERLNHNITRVINSKNTNKNKIQTDKTTVATNNKVKSSSKTSNFTKLKQRNSTVQKSNLANREPGKMSTKYENKQTKAAVNSTSQLLKIVTTEPNNTLNQRVTLASEKFIAKQQENKELREQISLLQAQLTDVKKLLSIKNQQSVKKLDNNSINQENETIVFSPFATKNITNTVNDGKSLSEINKSFETGSNTNTSMVVNKNGETAKESTNIITSIIGSIITKLSRVTKKVINNENLPVLKLSLLFGVVLVLVSLIYSYWRKYYYNRPLEYREHNLAPMFNEIDIPDFDQDLNSKVDLAEYIDDIPTSPVIDKPYITNYDENSELFINDVDYSDYNGDSSFDERNYEFESDSDSEFMRVTSKYSKFKDNFDLVRAYIELNDYITARKILDEILKSGSTEQKSIAKQIIKTLPAA